MMHTLRRLWIEWNLAIGFLREGRAQSLMITVGVAVGVGVDVGVAVAVCVAGTAWPRPRMVPKP